MSQRVQAGSVAAGAAADRPGVPTSGDRERLRRRPGRGSTAALGRVLADIRAEAAQVAGPAGVGPLAAVVDAVVAARRLAGWALYVELAGLAQLEAFWEDAPPVTDEMLRRQADPGAGPDDAGGDACRAAEPELADRLHAVIDDLELPRPVSLGQVKGLASAFVTSELSAAAGASRHAVGLRLDAARALFREERLPRTRALLAAGLLDWTKITTLVTGTRDLDLEVARLVEARVIPDADLASAAVDPLDVRADPAAPGAPLPGVTRMTNPALERALRAALVAIDAEAAAARAAKARSRRMVSATALADSMARLQIEAGQEAIAAVMNDLDAQVAAARAAGDTRTPDQVRTDSALHRLTRGAYGNPEPTTSDTDPGDTDPGAASDEGDPDLGEGVEHDRGTAFRPHPTDNATDTDTDVGTGSCSCSCGGDGHDGGVAAEPGLAISLTMGLSTWLGLAEDPAVLDRFGPIPAGLARRIAADAARDHPTTTTWRCVTTDDDHTSVLAVADPMRTPRHDPPPRLANLVRATHPRCVFPGCATPARRCELDHRIPWKPPGDARGSDDPGGGGGATCSCNLQPLCGVHHRLKTAGLITATPAPPATPGGPPAGVIWTTATGGAYRYDTPPPTPPGADPLERVYAASRHRSGQWTEDNAVPADPDQDHLDHLEDLRRRRGHTPEYDENWATHAWQRSLHQQRSADRADQAQAAHEQARKNHWTAPDDPPF